MMDVPVRVCGGVASLKVNDSAVSFSVKRAKIILLTTTQGRKELDVFRYFQMWDHVTNPLPFLFSLKQVCAGFLCVVLVRK